MKRVLILRSDVGGGHKSISLATKQIIQKHLPSCQIKQVNIMPKIGSSLQRISGDYFINSYIKKYQATNNEQSAKNTHRLITPIVFPKILKHISSFKPDLIISTNAFSTEEVGITLKILNKTIPHLIILADPFSMHHAWTTYKSANKYLVHDPQTKSILIQRDIKPNKIAITGLPLKQQIVNADKNPSRARQKLGLSQNKIIIFIGGSGEGLGKLYQLVLKLLKLDSILNHCQIIISTGKSKILLKKFQKLQTSHPSILFPFGFTNQIHQLIIASHFVVSKPGPNLILETLTLGKPFISVGIPMSQEKNNNRYLKTNHLGFITIKQPQTIKLIDQIITSPKILNQFQSPLDKWQKAQPNTSKKVWQTIKPFLLP